MDISDRPRYIFLEKGDIVQSNDEIQHNNLRWIPIHPIMIGNAVSIYDNPIRRKVK